MHISSGVSGSPVQSGSVSGKENLARGQFHSHRTPFTRKQSVSQSVISRSRPALTPPPANGHVSEITHRSLHSHARDVQRIPRSQTAQFRVTIPQVNTGSEPVQPPRLAGDLACASQSVSYIRREYKYLDILHVLYTYPKGVQDTFGIHIGYIRIHVSCAFPWCHTGYISGYIRIRVSWTLHHDTSGHTEIHAGYMQDSSWIHAGYIIHVSAVVRGYIGDTCGIHSNQLNEIHVSQMYPERYVSET